MTELTKKESIFELYSIPLDEERERTNPPNQIFFFLYFLGFHDIPVLNLKKKEETTKRFTAHLSIPYFSRESNSQTFLR